MFAGPVRVPSEAGAGYARIALSIPGWTEGEVTPATIDGLILGGRDDAPGLAAALKTSSPVAREEIIKGIGHFCGKTDGIERVLLASLGDRDERVRCAAVDALQGYPQAADRIIPALIEALDDPGSEVAIAATNHLARYTDRGEAVVPALLESLREGNATMRWLAARALGGFDNQAEAIVPQLSRSLDDEASYVRSHAARALGQLGRAAAPTTERLLQALQDADTPVRNAVLEALQRVTGEDSERALLAWAKQHHAAESSRLATAMLQRRGALFSTSPEGGLQVRFGRRHQFDAIAAALLGEVDDLKEVSLAGTRAGDADLASLRGTPIEILRLNGCNVTHRGLRYLADLPQLRRLDLGSTTVTDAGLGHLKEMPQLQYVGFHGTRLSGSGLAHLAELPRLRELYLRQATISGTCLGQLSRLGQLKRLSLDSASITDSAINYLTRLESLEEVRFENTRITPEGAARLRAKLPGCEVIGL